MFGGFEMLSPIEIMKRRLGGRSNLSTIFIQQRNSSPDDNNNSHTTKKSTSQTPTHKNRKTIKKASCCVAQSSSEELVQSSNEELEQSSKEEIRQSLNEEITQSSNEEITQAEDVKNDTETEGKGTNKSNSKGDKSRFEDAYGNGKKKNRSWADKSIKDIIAYKNTILDKVPGGFRKRRSIDSATVSLMEYYEDEIAGEKVIVNKQLLYSTDDDRDITIVIRDYLTPEDYLKKVEYYRQVNKARDTYMRAAAIAGDCLQRGEVEGDREEWALYLDKLEKDKKSWHKMCEKRHLLRDKDIRYEVKTIPLWTRIWNRCVEEYKDIFPCCFPP